MIPTNREPEVWFKIAVDFFERYDITTKNRIAGFMAQCAHESRDFQSLEENLNYSINTLLKVFPRYFGPGKENPAEYAKNPQKLANYVYMDINRSKNGALGNTQPGDGWRFRGGGIKQLTGRNNFTAFGKDMGMTAEEAADYVRTKKGAFESACWFWKRNNIARFADSDDIDGMSRVINGGKIGLEDRRRRYSEAKLIIDNQTAMNEQAVVLKRGSTGNLVKQVQLALKIGPDGTFGPGTEMAVKSWQRTNKYISNGILDSKQLKHLLENT